MPRRVGAIVVVLLSLTMVGRAKAQSGPYDDDDEKGAQRQPSKEAVELLLTGEELMGAGRYAEALQKLTGSLKLFMSARTQLRRAVCLSHLGKLLEAENVAIQARDLAQKETVRARHDKQKRRAELMAKWAHDADKLAQQAAAAQVRLTILVPSAAAAQAPTVSYRRLSTTGGASAPTVVRVSDYNHVLRVNPGHYRILSEAAQKNTWQADVYPTHGGDQLAVTLPALTPAPQLGAPPDDDGSSARAAALWLGVLGPTTMVVGGIMGGHAQWSQDAGAADRTGASLLMLGIGGAMVGVAGILWAENPRRARRGVTVGVGPTSAMLRVRF
ncbi:MAG TPA: hypothetical protein ENK23_07875 [Sorangium sp.]|nr:hypothetical protein [Sorangium sp.]